MNVSENPEKAGEMEEEEGNAVIESFYGDCGYLCGSCHSWWVQIEKVAGDEPNDMQGMCTAFADMR